MLGIGCTDKAPAPFSNYSQAVEIPAGARIVTVSGQVGVHPNGELPDGMTLSPAGRLSGVPTAAGNYFIQIRAEGNEVSRIDGQPLSHTAQFIVTIAD